MVDNPGVGGAGAGRAGGAGGLYPGQVPGGMMSNTRHKKTQLKVYCHFVAGQS